MNMHCLPAYSLIQRGAVAACLAGPALAQVTFSVDGHAPLVGRPEAWSATPITEGDILTPGTNLGVANIPLLAAPNPPGIYVTAGPTGLGLARYLTCLGHTALLPCPIEVDALSYGLDDLVQQSAPVAGTYRFSVDAWAYGYGECGTCFTEMVWEGAGGAQEAAANVFLDRISLAPPLAPGAVPTRANLGCIDGDGLKNSLGITLPGFGLGEPCPAGPPPDMGDNLDAFDQAPSGTNPGFPIYYSLDASFPDPITGVPWGGTAVAHGFSGADVIVSAVPGGPPAVYASAAALGLDVFGVDSDDLDALALREDGIPGFSPSQQPYDWSTGTSDMLLFSVRRGSAVIGMPDSIFNFPIEPGDILTTPLAPSLGGISPFPGIFIAAENLGLWTARSDGVLNGDELDALDVSIEPLFDCNSNRREDALDIDLEESSDLNSNGVPDDCELIAETFCYCDSNAPCANVDPNAGCKNATGAGGLMTATGTSSILNDDLYFTMTSVNPSVTGLFVMGPKSSVVPFDNGQRCVGTHATRPGGQMVGTIALKFPVYFSGMFGVIVDGPIVSYANANFPASWHIGVGTTRYFQGWYRDPAGPCILSGWNSTNAMSVLFSP